MILENLKRCNLCGSDNIASIDRNNNICQCRNCGYVFDNPRPTLDEIISYYSQSDKYDSWFAEEKERDLLWKRRLRMIKRHKKSGTLLDVGTGTGQFLFLAKNDFKVKGTEISESAIKIAKQKYNVDVIRGEIESIKLDSKFDVITLFHVLEHVPNPSSTIKRCRELLNNEGVLIIAVPNDVFGILPIVRRFVKHLLLPKIALDGSRNEVHLSHFTPSVLEEFLERNGFIIIESTLDPYYVAKGFKRFFHDLLYFFCLLVMKISRTNIYRTIWIAAKKSNDFTALHDKTNSYAR
jgi:SAM-dependent methyltransferase